MDSLESLNRKIQGASDIKSVVKTMKSLAASNIGQYEAAVSSLDDYYHTVALGLVAYFIDQKIAKIPEKLPTARSSESVVYALVFGSDQGLVGAFNDSLAEFAAQRLRDLPGKKQIWAVGERMQLLLSDKEMHISRHFPVPISVMGITPLIGQILIDSQQNPDRGVLGEFYFFYNKPKSVTGYFPVVQRLLPLDENWRQELIGISWPSKLSPRIVGSSHTTFSVLIREFLFISLFKACAESLASENASRLAAMQRAEKNIEALLEALSQQYHRVRQSGIDEELFDLMSGFEGLNQELSAKI